MRLTVDSIANYGVILYIQLGMTGFWPLLLSAFWVLSTFPGNIFCAFFVERFGRRRFLLIGLSGILVSLICEIAIQATYLGTDNRVALNFGVFFIFLVSLSLNFRSPDVLQNQHAVATRSIADFQEQFITPFWSTFMDASQFLYV